MSHAENKIEWCLKGSVKLSAYKIDKKFNYFLDELIKILEVEEKRRNR